MVVLNMGLYHKDSFQNLLMYNQLFYNLLKNKISENEIILFIEDIINIDNEVTNIIITNDMLNNDMELNFNELIIDITNNKLNDVELYQSLKTIFISYGYCFSIEYDFKGRRFIYLDFK